MDKAQIQMKTRIAVAMISITFGGCSSISEADKAIAAQDYRLFQLPVRGLHIPGISLEERKKAVAICGVKMLSGVTDFVKTTDQLKSQKELISQAKEYNVQVYKACLGALLN